MDDIKNITSCSESFKYNSKQKLRYFCEDCKKEVIRNANRVRVMDRLLCKGCYIKYSKTFPKKVVSEGDLIKTIEEVKSISRGCLQTEVYYFCKECGVKEKIKVKWLLQHTELLCPKCASKKRSQILYNTDFVLQKMRPSKTVSEDKKIKSWFNQRNHYWWTDWEKREQTIKYSTWDLIDKDGAKNTLLLRCNLCGSYKKFHMGSCCIGRFYCDCSKPEFHTRNSRMEEDFVRWFNFNFPGYETVRHLRNWCKDPTLIRKDLYEIDLYIPNLKLGFEFNGEQFHHKNYSVKEELKVKRAFNEGIKLINIWSSDWLKNRDYLKQIISLTLKELTFENTRRI